VGAALTLTGCGAGALPADEVADAAEDALEQEVGVRPDISCPDALAREEGATTRCTLTSGEDSVEYGVTVTVTSAEGDRFIGRRDTSIGVTVDDEPQD
jgi:hypothetical protein